MGPASGCDCGQGGEGEEEESNGEDGSSFGHRHDGLMGDMVSSRGAKGQGLQTTQCEEGDREGQGGRGGDATTCSRAA